MPLILFDTSVYIAAFRLGNEVVLSLRRSAGSSVWMSSVVLEELYAGSTSGERHFIEHLERDFDRVKRTLVPNLTDWTSAGKILAGLAAKYDYELIGRSRITNDALIATSAARTGITVVTTNRRDFARLAEIRPFNWRLWDI